MWGKKKEEEPKEIPKVRVYQKPKQEEQPEEIEEVDDVEKFEEEKPSKTKERIQVVKELPMAPLRRWKDPKTGEITNFITVEEALDEIINKVREE